MSLPVAILAGGLATRLRPVTDDDPKALVEVAGRPFVEHQLDWLRDAGRRPTSCSASAISASRSRDALGDGVALGHAIRLRRSTAPTLLGTGGALRRALPLLGDAFFVLYGDSLPRPATCGRRTRLRGQRTRRR